MTRLTRSLLAAGVLLAVGGCGGKASTTTAEGTSTGGTATEASAQSALHHPGEACVQCHSKGGSASSASAFAGTVFVEPATDRPAHHATVRVVDARKVMRCAVTNCAGNFFFREEEVAGFVFPLRVWVERTSDPGKDETMAIRQRMLTTIGSERSCAGCHALSGPNAQSAARVHLWREGSSPDLGACDDSLPLERCPEDW